MVVALLLGLNLAQEPSVRVPVPGPSLIAIVRSSASPVELPSAGVWKSEASLREWAERNELEVRIEPAGLVAWPRDLFGLEGELELLQSLSHNSLESKQGRLLSGSDLAGPLRELAADETARSRSKGFKAPSSMDSMDFSIGLLAWIELVDGDRRVRMPVVAPDHPMNARPGRLEKLETGKGVEHMADRIPLFDSVPGLRVDFASPPDRPTSVRDRVEFGARATRLASDAVCEVSDEIRRLYQAIFASLGSEAGEELRRALTGEFLSTTELPSSVSAQMLDNLESRYSQFGFASSSEASDFFARASIGRRRAQLSLQFASEKEGRRTNKAIGIGGTFTPR